MAKNKTAVPAWTKIVLAFFLLILLVAGFAVAFLNITYSNAEQNSSMPELAGYKYCPVPNGNYGEKYAAGSLLLIEKQDSYQPGDEVLTINREVNDDSLVFNKRYLLLRLTKLDGQEAEGLFIGKDASPFSFYKYEIIGRVSHIIPFAGGIYEMMLGLPGILLFLLLPIVITTIWIIIMVNMYARRQAEPERYGLSTDSVEESQLPELFDDRKREKPHPASRNAFDRKSMDNSFDLFGEEPLDAVPVKEIFPEVSEPVLESLQPEEKSDAGPGGKNYSCSPFMDPIGRRMQSKTPFIPASPSAGPPEPAVPPLYPETGDYPEEPFVMPEAPTAPMTPVPIPEPAEEPPEPDILDEDEAVAVYPQREPETAARFEPAYLNQDISESLEELKRSLRQTKRNAQEVDIVIGDNPAGLDADKQRRLNQINSFDPDRAIKEIKRRNALFERAFEGRAETGKKPGGEAFLEKRTENREMEKKYRAYPAESAAVFLKEQMPPEKIVPPEEVVRNHRKDFDEHRFRPSFITVVEEENDVPEKKYHNRNDNDG